MGPKTEKLIASLGAALFLIREQGDDFHANQVAKCKVRLERSDFRGVTHVLGVFNGKNSIHEIEWPPSEDSPDRASAKDRFGMLVSTINELAVSIRREVELGDR